MTDKENGADGFAEAQAELVFLTEQHDEKIRWERSLLDSTMAIDAIFQRISDMPTNIDADMESLKQCKQLIDYVKITKSDELKYLKRKNAETAQKHAAFNIAQDAEYERKVEEMEGVQDQCEYLQNLLTQRKAKVADLHDQLDKETKLFVQQRVALCDLRSKSKVNNAKFVDEQEALRSVSAKLEIQFRSTQTDIEKLREENAAMEEELVAVQSDNNLKSIELAALRPIAAANKKKYDDEKEKQFKIMSEFQLVEEQRKIEITRLQQQLSAQRAVYSSSKQIEDDLSARITSKYGNSKSLTQVIAEAQAELRGLAAVGSRLTGSVDVFTESMNANEARLQELQDEREEIFEQLDRMESAIHQQGDQITEDEQMHSDDSDNDSEEDEQIGPQQMDDSSNDSDDGDEAVPIAPQREPEEDQDVAPVCSPDSSMVSDWAETTVGPNEVDEDKDDDDYYRRIALFADTILLRR